MTDLAVAPPRRGARLAFWLVWLATLLCFLTLGAYAPTLPDFVLDEVGGAAWTVGLVTGVTAVVAIVFRPAAGAFGDRSGRRLACVTGAAFLAVGPALLVVSHWLPLVLVARLATGLGDALLAAAAMAWVIDETPPERRGRALGIYGTAIWLGLGLGPQFAELLRDWGGFDAVWLGLAGAAVLAGVVVGVAPKPSTPDHDVPPTWFPMPPRGAVAPGAVIALALIGDGVLASFGVIHLTARGVPDGGGVGGAASIFTVFAITTFATRAIGGGLVDRLGPRRCGSVATLLIAAGWTVIALASSFAAAAAAAVLVGMGMALLYPAMGAMVADRVPAAQRGAGLGAFMACMDIGMGIGAVGGGLVVGATSTAVAFWWGVVAALGAWAMLQAPWAR